MLDAALVLLPKQLTEVNFTYQIEIKSRKDNIPIEYSIYLYDFGFLLRWVEMLGILLSRTQLTPESHKTIYFL